MQYQFLHHDRSIYIYMYILVYWLWIYVIEGIDMGDSGWNKCGWKEDMNIIIVKYLEGGKQLIIMIVVENVVYVI